MVKTKLDDYRLFMWVCVFCCVVWVYTNFNHCFTGFDEVLLVVFSLGFMLLPYVVRRYRFFG